MSDLIVNVVALDSVEPHPNADRLDIAVIGGWQVVVGRSEFVAGDRVIYVPPDTIVPPSVAEEWGVGGYLSKGGRVKQIRLRGEPSFGFAVAACKYPNLTGSVIKHFGLKKYEPPVRGEGNKILSGSTATELVDFPRYTDIQNLRHYPNIIEEGELVFIQEKIHGTNCRVGMIHGVRLAGSRKMRRKSPDMGVWERVVEMGLLVRQAPTGKRWKLLKRFTKETLSWVRGHAQDTAQHSTYWKPWDIPQLRSLIEYLSGVYGQVVVYGEIYGPSIQGSEMHYGLTKPDTGFAVFDVKVNGRYVDSETLTNLCIAWDVNLAPIIWKAVPFNMQTVATAASGNSRVDYANHIKEGVVVRPIKERTSPKLGRVILKYCSDAYLLSKHPDFAEV